MNTPRVVTAKLWLATGAIVSSFALAGASHAQVSGTWLGGFGDWTNGALWSSAPAYPDNGGTAYFPAAFAGDVSVPVPITVSRMTFDPASQGYRVGGPWEPTMRLTGVAEINVEAAPAQVFSSFTFPPDYDPYAPMIGGLTGPAGLTKTGGGLLQLSAINDFAGDIQINDGTLLIHNWNEYTVPLDPIKLNGGTLRSTGAALMNPIIVTAQGGRIATGTTIAGPISGSGALELDAGGLSSGLMISGASTFTGTTTVIGTGRLTLNDGGSFGNGPVVAVGDSTISLEYAANATADRIGDASRITLRTGTVQLEGHASQAVTEQVGTIEFSQSATLRTTPASSGTSAVTLRALALKRVERGLITISSDSERSRIEVVHAPTLVGGGGAPGSQNMSIVPFALGMITYDNGRLRALTSTEYAPALPVDGGPTDRNVSLGASTQVDTPVTVNSLRLGSNVALGGGGSVTISSGVLAISASTVSVPINFGSSEGVLSGSGTLSGAIAGTNGVTVAGYTVFSSSTNTYSGLTTVQRFAVLNVLADVPASGIGPLGTDTSPVQLNANSELRIGVDDGNGTYTFARPLAIRGFVDPQSNLGSVQLYSGFDTIGNHVTFTGDIDAQGSVSLTGGALTFDGTISGDARFSAFASRTVTFNRANTFTGGLRIGNGTLVIGNDLALGTGRLESINSTLVSSSSPRVLANEFFLYAMTIAPGPALTFTGPTHTFWSGQINSISDADVTLAGPIDGANPLAFNGTAGGALRLSGSSPNFAGTTTVVSGALYVENGTALGSTVAGTSIAAAGSINLAAGVTIAGEPLAVDANGIIASIGSPTPQLRGLGNGSSAWNGPITFTGGDAVIGVESNGTMSLASVSLTAGKSLAKVGPGTLIMPRVSPQEINVADGTLRFASSVPSNQSAKAFRVTLGNASATLDLSDNDLHITGGNTLGDIEAKVRAAYDFGAWDGVGITSSTARENPIGNTTLGVMRGQQFIDNSGSNVFDGNTVSATDVLVKYTYYGDVDFNGQVDVSDYNLIDFGFVNGLTGWANGDADYSGAVDVSDYNLIDFAFTTQNGTILRAISYLDGTDRSTRGMNDEPSLREVATHFEQFGEPYAAGFLVAVPEPASVVSAIAAVGVLRRRRRR